MFPRRDTVGSYRRAATPDSIVLPATIHSKLLIGYVRWLAVQGVVKKIAIDPAHAA